MRLTPSAGNPFTSHAAPLQEGRRLAAQGQLAEACLATEAAARVRPCTASGGQQFRDLSARTSTIILSCQGQPSMVPAGCTASFPASQKAQGKPLFHEGALTFLSSLQIAPSHAGVWAQLGRCRLQAERHNLAVPPLQRAALLQPGDEHNLWLLTQAAAAAGRKADAIEAIEQLTALRENYIDAPGGGRTLDARLEVGPS